MDIFSCFQKPSGAQANGQLLPQLKKEVTDTDPGSVCIPPTNAGEQIREAGSLLAYNTVFPSHEGHRCGIKPPEVLAPSSPVPAPRRAKAAGSATSALSNLRDK